MTDSHDSSPALALLEMIFGEITAALWTIGIGDQLSQQV
jgi:hypothetical protein